jgi:hypothetical protein
VDSVTGKTLYFIKNVLDDGAKTVLNNQVYYLYTYNLDIISSVFLPFYYRLLTHDSAIDLKLTNAHYLPGEM